MPVARLFCLQTAAPAGWPARPHDLLRGWFYRDLLEHAAPDQAAAIHRAEAPGPATLALLPERDRQRLRVRLTVLDDALDAALAARLAALDQAPPGADSARAGEPVRLGSVTGWLASPAPEAAPAGLAGHETMEELVRKGPVGEWRPEFLTPTTFRSHEANLPLPVPEKLCRSWLRRWNLWTPPEYAMPETLPEAIDRAVSVVDFTLEQRRHPLRRDGLPGFRGRLTLRVEGTLSDVERAMFNTLAHFAPYAGTGRETMRGKGVTRVR